MKIHFLSDSPRSNSGFANVTKNLALGLKKLDYDISISGFQTAYPEFYNGIEVLPMISSLDETSQFQRNIMKINPDIVIYVNDAYTDARKFLNIFPCTFSYTPVEGRCIPSHMVTNLNNVSKNGKVISQCKYGYEEMIRNGINVHSYIYHGYNPNVFYHIEDRNIDIESKYCYYSTEQGQTNIDSKLLYDHSCQNCKFDINEQINCLFYKEETITLSKYDNNTKQWMQIEGVPISKLRENINPSKKFMFLSIATNHMIRKKIERLLTAYSILIGESKQLSDRIHLHLHSNPISPTGIDLLEIANRLNIQNNISFSYGNWSENALNILYNISDVGISASSSEGFGLDTLQSMTVGNPYIAPNNTSFTELIGEIIADSTCENKTIGPRGLLARIQADYMLQDLTYRSLVDEVDLASKMKEIYNNKNIREKYSNNAIKFSSQYTWEKVVLKWSQLLKNS